jgi:two-component system heavy metal sensor histidine kinase CusS
MSLKSAERRTSAPGLSITSRLVILFTVAAVLILTLTSGILYWGLAKSLEERSSHYLRDEVNMLRAMLVKPDGLEEVKREIAMETGTLEYVQHYVRVLDKGGNVLIETAGMGQIIPASAFPRPTREETRYGKRAEWRTADGQVFMLKALCTELGDAPDRVRLQVALNSTRRMKILTEYREKLLIVGFFGVLGSLAASVWVSRRGLRPLREIVSITRRVTATHLDERLQARHWPKELHELAGSYDLMLDRLQDSFDRLSQFASNMAHEFRTPLSNLMGEAEVALGRERSPEEYRQVLESGLEEYRRLGHIVDSLLFLARAENGAHPLTLSLLNLRDEVDLIAEYYRPMAEEKGIELAVSCVEDAPLAADANLFRRAVGNLIANALRYTPGQGKVTISWALDQANGIEVAVTDTGCGIAEEDMPKLFDRFYRVETTRTKHPQGFGLGLSIVKSIMDLHGGTVAIRSQVDAGTTVTLRFPSPPASLG